MLHLLRELIEYGTSIVTPYPGEVVVASIEGIGTLRMPVVGEEARFGLTGAELPPVKSYRDCWVDGPRSLADVAPRAEEPDQTGAEQQRCCWLGNAWRWGVFCRDVEGRKDEVSAVVRAFGDPAAQ